MLDASMPVGDPAPIRRSSLFIGDFVQAKLKSDSAPGGDSVVMTALWSLKTSGWTGNSDGRGI